ncbi:hypothetical protein ACFOHW_16430 [Paenibacillus abyssi]|uniref:Uncharacterized protein n=1 Tax=Paenibacillus abyssi TaxID=1340531 RepID=A0A917LFY9_9BACL|nr:hypothetical protein GCM10010916_39910 [Paenibacillus abyssi]
MVLQELDRILSKLTEQVLRRLGGGIRWSLKRAAAIRKRTYS